MAQDSIYTMTPGSATSDALQEILTNKRLEARQNMLDDLNRQKVMSEMNYQNENIKSLQEERSARATQSKAMAQAATDKQGESVRRRQALDEFVKSPDFAKLDPSQQAQGRLAASVGSDQVIDQFLTNLKPATNTKSGGYIWTSGRDGNPYNTGQFMEGVTGDQYHETPAPAAPQQQHYQDLGPELDDAGKPTGNRSLLDLNTGKISNVKGSVGPKGKSATPPNEVPYQMSKQYADYLKKATDEADGRIFSGKKASQADKTAFLAFQEQVMNRFSDNIAHTGREIQGLGKATAPFSNEQLIEQAVKNQSIDQTEAQGLYRLLSIIRPGK